MKRAISALILAATLFLIFAFPVSAAQTNSSRQTMPDGSVVYYFEDGSYLTVSPVKSVENGNRTQTSTIREARYTNSDDVDEWVYTLHGTFSYTYGVSSTCTNAYYTQTIYEGNWTFSDGNASHSGNVAHGVGTYTEKFWFITLRTVDVDISITCDIYGNFT